jgi:predicted phosphohydrolase
MKFVAISDTHGKHRELVLPKGDVIIHAGDFCHYGGNIGMHDFLSWFQHLDFQFKILIAGNHDFFAAEQSAAFLEMLPDEIVYLNDSGTSIQGINIWGSPVQPDLPGWAFSKERGAAMKAHWDLIPDDTDMLITHSPPHGILDKPRTGIAVGCEELSLRLARLQVRVHIFGHIHESYGMVRIGACTYINAANYNSSKGLVNAPIVFEFHK